MTSDKIIQQRFNSVEEWLAFIESPTDMKDYLCASMKRRTGWSGTANLPAAIKLARDGWQEGLALIERLSSEISEDIVKILEVPEIRYDVTGDVLDIERYVNDEPENFMYIEPAEVEQEPKVLHVVVNVGASGGTATSDMIQKGAIAVALIDALERHGKRIVVDCAVSTGNDRHRGYRIDTYVRVKEAHYPLQLANLVFLLAHPSTYRRLMFRSWEHAPYEARRAVGIEPNTGYGSVNEIEEGERGDIYIGSMRLQRFGDRVYGEWGSDPKGWVKRKLEEQGIAVRREDTA